MKRGHITKQREPVWRPLGLDGLEVCLVPAAACNVFDGLSMNVDPDTKTRRVCTRAFVDFRGYTEDDGQPVENTLEARMELYGNREVRISIDAALLELSGSADLGEGGAASG